MRILLVEDEPDAARIVAKGLREQTYAVDVVGDGEAACYQAAVNDYDAIVLDVLLPLKDGFAVCRQLRAEGAAVPILMVTARDSVEARVAGLDCGADDYLTKPFDFGELLARLRALIRRGARPPLPERLQIADVELDTRAHRVRRRGKEIPLTAREYALFEYLARHAGEAAGCRCEDSGPQNVSSSIARVDVPRAQSPRSCGRSRRWPSNTVRISITLGLTR